jgi:A/G-specific adenine glycosylase
MEIGNLIVDWYEQQGRDLPWRKTKDPYLIWISEIVFQQTRIAQGTDYFNRFISRFPDIFSLASADISEVMKLWEGLGYYARARNLHATAQKLVSESNGEFPDHYTELMKLKGIGPYTARAIGSFAFDNITGVIDGNVLRLMSRVLNDFSPVNLPQTRSAFQKIIDQWVPSTDPASFNHGVMDLGSTVCTPVKPACLICPLESYCKAREVGSIHLLPVKDKKKVRPVRYFRFFILEDHVGQIAIRRRPAKGFWGGLWEIPNEEVTFEAWEKGEVGEGMEFAGSLKHVFTHFDMQIRVYRGPVQSQEKVVGTLFIKPDKIRIFAFARAVLKIFERWL